MKRDTFHFFLALVFLLGFERILTVKIIYIIFYNRTVVISITVISHSILIYMHQLTVATRYITFLFVSISFHWLKL